LFLGQCAVAVSRLLDGQKAVVNLRPQRDQAGMSALPSGGNLLELIDFLP
jgi:hypothetical protein